MHRPSCPRLRGVISANVIAALALFFGLSGTALAGVKYLTASDSISAGDLAGSTYGAPVIAPGRVTSAKIADGAITSSKFDPGAVAPNSLQLGGHPASDFPAIVASISQTLDAAEEVAPGSCLELGSDLPAGVDPATDYVLVQPDAGVAESLSVSGRFGKGIFRSPFELTICNPTNFVGLAGGTYRILFLR